MNETRLQTASVAGTEVKAPDCAGHRAHADNLDTLRPMTLLTPLWYLLGSRRAVLQIAATPGAIWMGLLFVLSAGLAREYDGAYLAGEPWQFLIPVGASLGTSLVLFGLLHGVGQARGRLTTGFWGDYRAFLTLYWMTAPLAWLYAIPVERLMSPGDAMLSNLYLLLAVSVWRVILITHVVVVLFGARGWAAFVTVMLFADTLALVLLMFSPVPLLQVMGGVRLSASERVIQGMTFMVGFWGAATWLIWLIGTIAAIASKSGEWTIHQTTSRLPLSRKMWLLPAAALLPWAVILPLTQPEQRLRHLVESDLKAGRLPEAIERMSAHEQREFPPHWDPPPRIGHGTNDPQFLELAEIVDECDAPTWVRDLVMEKLRNYIGTGDRAAYFFLNDMDDKQFERYLKVLNGASPQAATLRAALREELAEYFQFQDSQLGWPAIVGRRESLRDALEVKSRQPM